MTNFSIECRCQQQLNIPESLLGRAVSCGGCGAIHRLIVGGAFAAGSSEKATTPGALTSFTGRLQIVSGPSRIGETLFLGGEYPIFIGKLPGKQIVLVGERVSRNHCKLMPTGKSWWIEDQNSTNGIGINGVKVGSKILVHGDRLHIGDYDLVYLEHFNDEDLHNKPAMPSSDANTETVAGGGTISSDAPLAPPWENPDSKSAAKPAQDFLSGPSPVTNHLAQPAVMAATPNVEDYELNVEAPVDAGAKKQAAAAAEAATENASEPGILGEGTICPSCEKRMKKGAQICAACGIYIADGKPLLTPKPMNIDLIYANTETILRGLSWLIWMGLYPFASEAYGSIKPYTVWTITALTILVSCWFWSIEIAHRDEMPRAKNLMLWAGNGKIKPQVLEAMYEEGFGDTKALAAKIRELRVEKEKQAATAPSTTGQVANAATPAPAAAHGKHHSPKPKDPDDEDDDENEFGNYGRDEIVAADQLLPPEQRAVGTFHWYQLFTHALLHGGLAHISGNLLFLLIFGTRVNALIGNVYTAILYPILAVGAAWAHMLANSNDPPTPLVGASGAIMGLAGMYLVLFPLYKVHMAFWVRFGLLRFFYFNHKFFALRGFWVVLFYIAFDVVYTALRLKDNVAHWAHLGGFICGMLLAVLLIVSRQVNTHGGDLLNVVFGKRAWPLTGRPSQWIKMEIPAMPAIK